MFLLVIGGCGRIGFDPEAGLVVSTTQDRMSGPPTISSIEELTTTDLSLREALAIAANHPGPDLITFSETVFPKAAPATIAITTSLVVGDIKTTIDAGGRGVIVTADAAFADPLLDITGESAQVIGLALTGGSKPRIQIVATTSGTLDKVRFLAPGAGGVLVMGSSDIAISNCVFETPSADAIVITTSTAITVEDSSIVHAAGIPLLAQQSTNLAILRNTIQLDMAANNPGVRLENVDQSKVVDNVIDPGPVQLISLQDSSDNEISGNILDRGNAGLALFGASSRNLVFRNVFIASSDEPAFVDNIALTNRFINNTHYLCGGVSDGAPDTQIANMLQSDLATDFVAPDMYDFHLAPGSAAIDAATDLGLDMLPDVPERFLGAAPDLGAVETR